MKLFFLFLSFPVIGLCNSSANSSFCLISFLIAVPLDFLLKKLQTTKPRPPQCPSYFGFLALLNALSRNALSKAILLGTSLKSP